jgi:hypothetical protein
MLVSQMKFEVVYILGLDIAKWAVPCPTMVLQLVLEPLQSILEQWSGAILEGADV